MSERITEKTYTFSPEQLEAHEEKIKQELGKELIERLKLQSDPSKPGIWKCIKETIENSAGITKTPEEINEDIV